MEPCIFTGADVINMSGTAVYTSMMRPTCDYISVSAQWYLLKTAVFAYINRLGCSMAVWRGGCVLANIICLS